MYRPKTGSIGWYDSGFGINGSERFTDCGRLNDTEIGHRLRFWLDEYRDIELDVDESDLPAERVNPTDRLSSEDRSAFFSELKEFVRSEQNAQRDKNWERYEDIELEEAIRRKRVSGPYIHLGSTVEDGEQAYKYQYAQDEDDDEDVDLRDDEGIFPGNRCNLDVESDDSNFPIEVEILSVTDPQVTILPIRDSVNNLQVVEKILDGGDTEIWLHELLNPVPFERRLDAIDQVNTNEEKRDLLTGHHPVTYAVNKYAPPDPGIDLNKYQRLALIWADGADDLVCIHGPLGTGKTRTLTAYIAHAVSRNDSVLVTAHSNQAVDNSLGR